MTATDVRTTVTADYLRRIGLPWAATPDLATLRAIVSAHTTTFAFENLDPYLGRTVRLDPVALAAKIVHGSRGGYCYEQNLLLRHVLDELGYRTAGLAGRVLLNLPPGTPAPAREHMLLRVELAEGPHIVDVGFGGLTLTGVLALETDVVQRTPHEPFRLVGRGREFDLQARVRDEWRTLYRFGLSEYEQSDYEMGNWWLTHRAESQFVAGLVVARPAADRRFTLRDRGYGVHHLGGRTERRTLGSVAEIRSVLEESFLLDLTGLDGLDDRLAELF